MHDYFVDLPDKAFKPWKEVVPDFAYDQKTPFFSMLVPTVDTVRYAFIFEHSVDVMKPVLFTGHSGVGKSVVVAKAMQDMVEIGAWGRVDLSFSAQTSAKRTQERRDDARLEELRRDRSPSYKTRSEYKHMANYERRQKKERESERRI